jgi:AraC family transcriptional regulator, regulatory protein of adaptative response / DNA-3-methyladenine glycosylase II
VTFARFPIALELPLRPPFEGAGLVEFLARRAVPGVEEVAGGVYRRSVDLPRGAGIVELAPASESMGASYWLSDQRDLDAAVEGSRALFDLDVDPRVVVDALGGDEVIGPLVAAAPGRRVPGHVDAHELAVRAVLGQQVSLAGARTLTARLVEAYGEPLARPIGAVTHLFPSAAALAEADPATFPMPAARQRALRGLTEALAAGRLALDPGGDRSVARERLLALPGIGPWTVEYIAMRALRDRDAFLATDLGLRHALRRLGLDERPAAALRLAERWRPYRAYAQHHLWATVATPVRMDPG